jgi:hypothetical protein
MTIRQALERECNLNHTWDGRLGVAEDLQLSLCCPSLITVPRIHDIGSHIRLSQGRIKAFKPCPLHSPRYVQVAQVTRMSSNGNSFGADFGRTREHAPRTFGAARSLQIDASCADPFRRHVLRQDSKEHEGAICRTSPSVVSSPGRGPDSIFHTRHYEFDAARTPPKRMTRSTRRSLVPRCFPGGGWRVNSVDRPRRCCRRIRLRRRRPQRWRGWRAASGGSGGVAGNCCRKLLQHDYGGLVDAPT